MTPLDDYRDEMATLSSEQIEGVLAGRPVDAPDAEPVARLARDLRERLLVDLHGEIEARHLAAMRAEVAPVPRRTRPRRVATRLALAAALVLGAGAAAATTARLTGSPSIAPEGLPIPAHGDSRTQQPTSELDPGSAEPADRPSGPVADTIRAPSARWKGCGAAPRVACPKGFSKSRGTGKGERAHDDRRGPRGHGKGKGLGPGAGPPPGKPEGPGPGAPPGGAPPGDGPPPQTPGR
ncbi:MAG TPA: hypothetical protein VF097_05505 [Actinomycetota bacterium]